MKKYSFIHSFLFLNPTKSTISLFQIRPQPKLTKTMSRNNNNKKKYIETLD